MKRCLTVAALTFPWTTSSVVWILAVDFKVDQVFLAAAGNQSRVSREGSSLYLSPCNFSLPGLKSTKAVWFILSFCSSAAHPAAREQQPVFGHAVGGGQDGSHPQRLQQRPLAAVAAPQHDPEHLILTPGPHPSSSPQPPPPALPRLLTTPDRSRRHRVALTSVSASAWTGCRDWSRSRFRSIMRLFPFLAAAAGRALSETSFSYERWACREGDYSQPAPAMGCCFSCRTNNAKEKHHYSEMGGGLRLRWSAR